MNCVDLFCGCGGLSLGFQEAGFEILAAFDNWDEAIELYKKNFEHPIYKQNLSDVDNTSEIRKRAYVPPIAPRRLMMKLG